MEKVLKILVSVILVINILALDVFLYIFGGRIFKSGEKGSSCPNECNILIEKKMTSIPSPVVTSPVATGVISPSLTPRPTISTMVSRQKSVQYIPIPGSGTTLENKWVDLSGTEFYINTDDYSGLMTAYFEANMKLLNGNGTANLRLFDVTAGVEVWGSEVSTNSQSFTSVSSGKMTIRNGNHLYRVQGKSLTADTTVFNSGRVKVVLEN